MLSVFNLYCSKDLLVLEVEVSGRYDFKYIMLQLHYVLGMCFYSNVRSVVVIFDLCGCFDVISV